jgi:hypothetical protein
MIISALISSSCIGLFFLLFTTVLGSSLNWAIVSMMVAFVFSLVTMLFLGIPIVITLKRYNKLNWKTILASGFFVGFIINLVITLMSLPSGTNYSSEENGQTLISYGVITILGWISYLKASLIQGFLGMIASAIFYKILIIREKKAYTEKDFKLK